MVGERKGIAVDMFADPMAELLARIEALEAAVFAKAPKAAKEAIDEPLMDAWQQWELQRRGKGWTANARAINMRRLRALAGEDGELAKKIVQQSVERGWTGLFPLKAEQFAALPPVQHKTVKQALAPTEDKLTAQLRWLRNQVERGVMTESEFNAEAEKARERMA